MDVGFISSRPRPRDLREAQPSSHSRLNARFRGIERVDWDPFSSNFFKTAGEFLKIPCRHLSGVVVTIRALPFLS